MGCETYASDYNPVSVILLKSILDYPNRFNHNKENLGLFQPQSENQFCKDVKTYGDYILTELRKELEIIYNTNNKNETPLCYIWSKSIPCQNPKCGRQIPLLLQYWLAKTKSKKISLFPKIVKNELTFQIIGNDKKAIPSDFDPSKGTVSKAIATCPICHYTTDANKLRDLFNQGKSSRKLMVVVYYDNKKKNKQYRLPEKKDYDSFRIAEQLLSKKIRNLKKTWSFNPIPDEPLPPIGTLGFRIQRYGLTTWGDLFNARQKLVIVSIIEKIHELHKILINKKTNREYADGIITYLSLMVDKIASSSNEFCRWQSSGEKIADMFGRQAVPMIWDYPEANILYGNSRSFREMFKDVIDVLSSFQLTNKPAHVSNLSATNLTYPDNFFDAVFTDPPYYDNVPYSYLSDFFYVWLKRSLAKIYPELFSTPLTPKSYEIVAHPNLKMKNVNPKKYFETMLMKSFTEISRVLKPNGIATIVYAHKSTEGWETLINSLLGAGLVVTAAWPINTEMSSRLNSHGAASLASSIYMVTRKQEMKQIGYYRDLKKELSSYLELKLEQLWSEGISGADFFISAIGSAIEVFGKYEKVADDSDNQISVSKLLDDTREIVTNYAIKQVLQGDFSAQISQMTRFYILWRWAYGAAKVQFDDARKMAQSVGIDIEHKWNKGFIVKESENIRVLGPDERNMKDLEKSQELIDTLHLALLLWKNKKSGELDKMLTEKGLNRSDVFKRVGQAISESLSTESTEKRWLEGFLTGFRTGNSRVGTQTKLF